MMCCLDLGVILCFREVLPKRNTNIMCVAPGRHMYSKYSIYLAFDNADHILNLMYSVLGSYENNTITHCHRRRIWQG